MWHGKGRNFHVRYRRWQARYLALSERKAPPVPLDSDVNSAGSQVGLLDLSRLADRPGRGQR